MIVRKLLPLICTGALGGCAHLLPPQPAWQCFAQAEADATRAMSMRLLDKQGRLIEGRDEWMRGFALGPRDFYMTEWERREPGDSPVDGVVTIRLNPTQAKPPLERYRLELRSGGPTGAVVNAGKLGQRDEMPALVLSWSEANHLLRSAAPLLVAATDASGNVRDWEPLKRPLFRQGLDLVRRTAAQVQEKAATYSTRCEKYQEIIPT